MSYTTITPGQVDADSPINVILMERIKDNFDDLVAGGGVPDGFIDGDKLENYTNGTTYLIINAAAEVFSTESGTYQKLKEIVIPRQGFISTSFDGAYGGGGGSTNARVYKNGVAVGAVKTLNTLTYTNYTDSNIAVDKGDLIQLYAKGDDGSLFSLVRDFKVQIANKVVLRVNIDNTVLEAPQMTGADRDKLVPRNGAIIYNTTTNLFNFYENGGWVSK